MNATVQFVNTVTISSGAGIAGPLSALQVSDGECLRVRAVEFRALSPAIGADARFSIGLSKRQRDTALATEVLQYTYPKFMAFWSVDMEVVTSGSYVLLTTHRVDVWDLDYRLVMEPTILAFSGFGAVGVVAVVVSGEFVPCSEGQRNAIIAWQGGPGA